MLKFFVSFAIFCGPVAHILFQHIVDREHSTNRLALVCERMILSITQMEVCYNPTACTRLRDLETGEIIVMHSDSGGSKVNGFRNGPLKMLTQPNKPHYIYELLIKNERRSSATGRDVNRCLRYRMIMPTTT
ncbi:uncharacterized protein F5Z01DRAFT_405060 [Emericellopsis atlantica]|uniref:Uncharacterized protein n=1 Tax=Emericellopsis atlantica TaxID=2614577 RepID=A0A9P8CS27_9HYPO|nr:uncharacterized protein F5Z01DRAFT_405060 [Emericellopsis atlantica]KAG9257624.1 hypothetical protein F5Z01DRAFT_405060 [Emericellopsis atlantica]